MNKSYSRLYFDINNCVRIYYRDSSCRKCIDICPVDALAEDDYKIIPDYSSCVLCGACIGVCNSEAFNIEGFSITEFYKWFISEKENYLSCKKNLPCLAVLDAEYLVSIVLRKKTSIKLNTIECKNCKIGNLEKKIRDNANEANFILENFGLKERVFLNANLSDNPGTDKKIERRMFLKNLGKTSIGLAFWISMPDVRSMEENKEKEELKNIVVDKIKTNKRNFFLEALENYSQNIKDKRIELKNVSFISNKWIDSSKCTNCSVCYNLCPTGSLIAGEERLKILFEPKKCINCNICHEVCLEKCIYISDSINISEFLYQTNVLAEHVMVPCEECMIPFSYKGDSTLCPRCRELGDEIKNLLDIGE